MRFRMTRYKIFGTPNRLLGSHLQFLSFRYYIVRSSFPHMSETTSEQPPEYLYDTTQLGSITANIGLGFIIAVTLITFYQSSKRRLKLLSFVFMVESILYFASFHFEVGLELLLLPSISFLLEMGTAAGYSVINYTQLRYFIKNKYDMRVIRFLDFLCLVTIVLIISADTVLIVAQAKIFEKAEDAEATLNLGDHLWSIYSLYDAAFNFFVSIRFAMFLKTLANPAMKAIVKRCLGLLFFECAFIIVANALVLSQVDENFTSTYVAVAIRIYLFSEFLKGLKKVTRDPDSTDRYFSKDDLSNFKSSISQKAAVV
ncbi:hypothetical protein BKA69DRAFT_1080278 [Paraphysoderma sedebokerense]|nr:hypothetical protein BKA69DRAFT_1080278 [Paraphysoderma sedebokerense]